MIAVVESGSTKSDWRIIAADGQVTETSTAGFNPYHVGRDRIVEELSRNQVLRDLACSVKKIHFYGAGCSSTAMNSIVQGAIQEVFAHAEVHVDHDLLGAALAAGQGSACIVGILGTGSNACFFDGADVDNGRPALGYVLGDEAGGSWFGKRIIADHLHGLLPEPMHAALENLGVTRESVLQRVYLEPRPNTYLAGFMPMLSEFRQSVYAQTLLRDGFTAFLTRYVCHFPQHSEVEVHLVGSVAHYFADELRMTAEQLGIRIGRIVHRPIDALVAYHTAR